jgi:hypothetical protein
MTFEEARMIRKRSAVLLGALSLGACASAYEARVRSSLVDAGLSPPMASCMAERMVDRLSPAQLKSLARLSGLRGRDVGVMSVDEFLRRSRALLDPEIYAVLARADLGCAIAG